MRQIAAHRREAARGDDLRTKSSSMPCSSADATQRRGLRRRAQEIHPPQAPRQGKAVAELLAAGSDTPASKSPSARPVRRGTRRNQPAYRWRHGRALEERRPPRRAAAASCTCPLFASRSRPSSVPAAGFPGPGAAPGGRGSGRRGAGPRRGAGASAAGATSWPDAARADRAKARRRQRGAAGFDRPSPIASCASRRSP